MIYDHFDGAPCANCESRPQGAGSLFCDSDCQDEYEGTGDFAEPDDENPFYTGLVDEEHEDRSDIDTMRDTQEA